MHFRGLSDVNSSTSCSYSASSSAPTPCPHFHLSRLSRAVGSARALRAAPLLTLGGALGALAISRLRSQTRPADARPLPGLCRASAMHGNAAPESTAESAAAAAAAAGDRADSVPEGGSSGAAVPSAPARESLSDSTQSRASSNGAAFAPTIRLELAAALIPHPDKADRGGEDAVFLGDDRRSFGIADGVGSWMDLGVDPGIYARELMAKCKEAAARIAPCQTAPVNILINGFYDTDKIGSSTACVLVLEGDTLHAANLGDSGFMVLRGKKILMRSRSQQHQFNFPYQLGKGGREKYDSPSKAEPYSVPLQSGDIILVATDGLWDNVFDQECAQLLWATHARGKTPVDAADALARYAHAKAGDKRNLSPFAMGAQRMGWQIEGGKMDDISVIVAHVVPASKL